MNHLCYSCSAAVITLTNGLRQEITHVALFLNALLKETNHPVFRDEKMTNPCLSQLNHTVVPLHPHQGPTLHCKFDNWVQKQVKLWVWQWANRSSIGAEQTAFPQRARSHRGDSAFMASSVQTVTGIKENIFSVCYNFIRPVRVVTMADTVSVVH